MGVGKWKLPLPSCPRERLLVVAIRFLVAFDTLVTGLTACALSVTCGDSSPKGRAKSTAGNFLITLKTLVTSLRPWLPPLGELARERLRGRARLTGAAPHPALRATFPRWVKASAAAENFAVTTKSRPLGEGGCDQREQTEGVSEQQRAPLCFFLPSPVRMV